MRVDELLVQWRREGEMLEPWAPVVARAFRQHADELEAAMREHKAETLTLSEAARETGYSPDHLGRLLKSGRIPNVGKKHAPRVRRADLPRKPSVAGPQLVADIEGIKRTALSGRLGR